jgi:hypothetical protein
MKGEEDIQHGFSWDYRFVKNDPGHLGVAGGFGADSFVPWVLGVPPGVANFNVLDTGKLHKA